MKQNKKRLCLFAGFDAQAEIADYVVYYLKSLSQIADVYYWGDFEISEQEKSKLKPYCKGIYCAKHGKYDFGSWQELIQKIGRKKIETYDELILANDSCYGPLFGLSELFQTMDERQTDFWGLSAAQLNHIHLQSYFIVLKKAILQSDVLYDFFCQVKPETNYNDVCLMYEDRFTYTLSKAGFNFSPYIAYSDTVHHPYWNIEQAIKDCHFPFLKVKFFIGGIRDQAGVADWRQIISKYTNYPVELIEEDLVRRGLNLSDVDEAVKSKRSETPDFYHHKRSIKRLVRKTLKTVLKPLINAVDAYISKSTSSYFYKIDRINKSYHKLQHAYNELQSQVDDSHTPHQVQLRDGGKVCGLKLSDRDVATIKRFDLELPLTSESHVLLIGNLSAHNLSSLELYDPQTFFLNNDWAENGSIQNFRTNNLCNFKFEDENNNPVYFDFILVQPLDAKTSNQKIKQFLQNLKQQMFFESVLALMVPDKEISRYEELLQSEDMYPARLERGLVVRSDPFQVYCDKIESIKGYKALIYKRK